MKLAINSATISDVSRVFFIALEGGMNSWSEKDFNAEIERQDAIFLVAKEIYGDDIVGFITGRLVAAGGGSNCFDAEVHNIAVTSMCRRHGVGTALFSKFREICNQKLVRNLWLEVRSQNISAIRFYERNGFKTKSVRSNYYRDPPDDAILMFARLFGVTSKLLE